MNWTAAILQEAEHLYLSRNSTQVAEELSKRYGCKVTSCTVRAAFCKYGISDTKTYPQDVDKAQRLIRKFIMWRWDEYEIAEQLSTWVGWVRTRMEAMKRPRPQLSLWDADAYTVPPKPMRIVHVAKKSKPCPWVQLTIPFETEAIRIAA